MAEQLPVWNNPGIEPSTDLKVNGWQPGQKPSAQHFNWLFNRAYKCLEDLQNNKADKTAITNLSQTLSDLEESFTSHLADNVRHVDYAVAYGTNNYTASVAGISQLIEGMSLKVKFTNANSGASTLNINGFGAKAIKKSNGNDLASGNIKANQILHLVYNGSNFQLLGEGGEYGNVTADKVLSGITFGTESGLQTGTMPNRGSIGTVRPGTSNKSYSAGYYEAFAVEGSANLVASNIKQGVNIFGITGTLTPEGMGGVRYATGTVTSSSQQYFFDGYYSSDNGWYAIVEVNGLTFAPKMLLINSSDSYTLYSTLLNTNYCLVFSFPSVNLRPAISLRKSGSSSGIDCYVNSTGFRLPVSRTSSSYTWCAWG